VGSGTIWTRGNRDEPVWLAVARERRQQSGLELLLRLLEKREREREIEIERGEGERAGELFQSACVSYLDSRRAAAEERAPLCQNRLGIAAEQHSGNLLRLRERERESRQREKGTRTTRARVQLSLSASSLLLFFLFSLSF
jgi:hypothetical protein